MNSLINILLEISLIEISLYRIVYFNTLISQIQLKTWLRENCRIIMAKKYNSSTKIIKKSEIDSFKEDLNKNF